MRHIYIYSLLFIYLLATHSGMAQIKIRYPESRFVFQRNNNNRADVPVVIQFDKPVQKIEIQAIARSMNSPQGTSTDWIPVQKSSQSNTCYTKITLAGGWYDLIVRAFDGLNFVGIDTLKRVGVGEVFIVAGQSNATGDNELRNQNIFGPSATDDRVETINYFNGETTTYGATKYPYPIISQIDSTFRLAPFGNSAWCWGVLGDSLAKKLNVPILFFNAGWSGSGISSWVSSAEDSSATPSEFITYPRGLPYGNLRSSLRFYTAQFGLRAILWHQGETDNLYQTDRDTYGKKLKRLIEKSREHSNAPNLAWVVARATRFRGLSIQYSRVWQPVIDAQNDVLGINGQGQANYLSNTFIGPATDSLIGPSIRTIDSVHFQGKGIVKLAQAWNTYLDSHFFEASTPILSTSLPEINSACASITSLKFTLTNPTLYSVPEWSNDPFAKQVFSNSTSINLSQNQFARVRVKDMQDRELFSPLLYTPNNFAGLYPLESTQSGYWHDTGIWSCGRIPTALDEVTILKNHEVVVGTGLSAQFKKLNLLGNLYLFGDTHLFTNKVIPKSVKE